VVAKGEAEEVAPHVAAHDYPVASCVAIVCWCLVGKEGCIRCVRERGAAASLRARAERRMAACVGLENGVTETRWHLC